ncbi:MAG: lamin tail domain-containing protein [Akkermansiaceae bacterium]|nr:lamin tail domain-containing protein [Akkermansiaceae bacterium]MDP4779359.1 lamin tail domain-containing protein [Akkermansiaceae bacterium]
MKKLFQFLLLLIIAAPATLHADVVINEFVADNETVLQDEDGDFSDWIELKNTSETAINLSGWSLTDDPSNLTKWMFPSVTIQPQEFLVVYASSKNRAVTGSQLHTNFGLSKNGEYLALVKADGFTIEHEYSPSFPAQAADQSYGLAGSITEVTLIGDQASCTALVPSPSDVSLGTSWQLVGFNDNSWDSGTTGVGYDTNTTFESLINLDLEADMKDENATAYIRVPFTVTSTTDIVALDLRMKYDDGFIAYINGVQVESKNPPTSTPAYNSTSSAQNPDSAAVVFEDFDLLADSDELVVGDNILSIHALNRSTTSSDMLIVPELSYKIKDAAGTTTATFLESPTPGAENTTERTATSAPIEFSVLSGVYSSSFSVTLSSASSTIYYTLDGSEPTTASSQYSAPISISSTTSLRARSIDPGLELGVIASETYTFLNADVVNFSSNLPVIVVDSLGDSDISNIESETSYLAFFEPGADGRTFLGDDFTLGTRAGIRRRGETSLRDTDNKPSLAVETWSPNEDDDADIAPLGMPAESDWILWAPHSRDLAGIRNAFIYNLSNQTGNYAVRTRFVEVFLNVSGGDVSMGDYAGLYVFMEKIKRGDDRVDVEALTSADDLEPDITGGYILRIDKSDPGQNSLSGTTQGRMYAEYPRPEDITTQQEAYITNYIIDFEAQLSNPDPATGYPSYIDVGSFVDHNLFNVLTKNADGLYFSTYMSKARGGKLSMGPIWDFDRSVDSANESRDDDPLGWDAGTSVYIDYTLGRHWWGKLFENADFWQAYVDRWESLRIDLFSDANINETIDGMAAEIAEARVRDIAKWGFPLRSGSNGLDGTQKGEIDYMKWWLSTRMAWIDSQFIAAPVISQNSGYVSNSFQLTLSAPSGDPIYYTLDGTDPRAAGGTLSPSAMTYTGAITVSPDSVVLARAWNGDSWGGDPPDEAPWSGLTSGVYYQQDLLLTEVHYNPRDPASPSVYTGDDFEFLEFQNTGNSVIDLSGYSLSGGINFSFAGSAMQSLSPGDFVVVVKNQAAFASRYDISGMNIAGAYTGQLSNSGENVSLEFYGTKVYDVQYEDSRGWPTAADGGGHSLIPFTQAISSQGFDILDYGGNWRASSFIDGSPGEVDPEAVIGLTVNEVIAHTDSGNAAPFDSNDVIELYNPTGSTIVLDGFWYLSDNVSNPEKWNIPSGTIIAPGAWVAFDEDDFHPARDGVGFGLDKAGEQVVLSYRPGGGLNRVVECIDFEGQANGASWGRYPDGDPYFQTLSPTVGIANQLLGSGIQITQLMYNPPTISGIDSDEVLEFIQLTNTSASTVVLEDLIDGSGTWRFDGGVDFTFSSGVSMSAGEKIWLVPFDPVSNASSKAFFCAFYGLDAGAVRLIGPYAGNLSDSGERITLERPQASDTIEAEDISWIIVDEATWLDESPWPNDADGTGKFLSRIGAAGNDPQSWTTDSGSYSSERVAYEKVSLGTSAWNAFTEIANVSDNDFADANSLNGVTIGLVAGTRDSSGAGLGALLDGVGQSHADDTAKSVFFTGSTTAPRLLVDLQSVQSVYQLNSYSWHFGDRQNQAYDLYYSAESTAPGSTTANAADSVALTLNGWIPLGSASSGFETDTAGQVGVSWDFTTSPLQARHFLIEIKSPDTYWGEIDIITASPFVIYGVPKSWLSGYGLAETDQAALLDSDQDGQFNWEEYSAGTNPLDATSVFKVTDTQKSGSQLLVTWNAVEGKTYSIQFKENLTEGTWSTVHSGVAGVAPEMTMGVPMIGTKGFVRVSVQGD